MRAVPGRDRQAFSRNWHSVRRSVKLVIHLNPGEDLDPYKNSKCDFHPQCSTSP